MSDDKIVIDQFIDAPTSTVWTEISTPDGVARWWAPGDIAATVGHRFTLEMPGWGQVPCEVIEAAPETVLAYTFADWTLRFTLTPEDSGTRLVLEHSGFDLDNPQHRFAHENMGPGWRDEVLPRLADVAHDNAES